MDWIITEGIDIEAAGKKTKKKPTVVVPPSNKKFAEPKKEKQKGNAKAKDGVKPTKIVGDPASLSPDEKKKKKEKDTDAKNARAQKQIELEEKIKNINLWSKTKDPRDVKKYIAKLNQLVHGTIDDSDLLEDLKNRRDSQGNPIPYNARKTDVVNYTDRDVASTLASKLRINWFLLLSKKSQEAYEKALQATTVDEKKKYYGIIYKDLIDDTNPKAEPSLRSDSNVYKAFVQSPNSRIEKQMALAKSDNFKKLKEAGYTANDLIQTDLGLKADRFQTNIEKWLYQLTKNNLEDEKALSDAIAFEKKRKEVESDIEKQHGIRTKKMSPEQMKTMKDTIRTLEKGKREVPKNKDEELVSYQYLLNLFKLALEKIKQEKISALTLAKKTMSSPEYSVNESKANEAKEAVNKFREAVAYASQKTGRIIELKALDPSNKENIVVERSSSGASMRLDKDEHTAAIKKFLFRNKEFVGILVEIFSNPELMTQFFITPQQGLSTAQKFVEKEETEKDKKGKSSAKPDLRIGSSLKIVASDTDNIDRFIKIVNDATAAIEETNKTLDVQVEAYTRLEEELKKESPDESVVSGVWKTITNSINSAIDRIKVFFGFKKQQSWIGESKWLK